jgi:hypothetical protein
LVVFWEIGEENCSRVKRIPADERLFDVATSLPGSMLLFILSDIAKLQSLPPTLSPDIPRLHRVWNPVRKLYLAVFHELTNESRTSPWIRVLADL